MKDETKTKSPVKQKQLIVAIDEDIHHEFKVYAIMNRSSISDELRKYIYECVETIK